MARRDPRGLVTLDTGREIVLAPPPEPEPARRHEQPPPDPLCLAEFTDRGETCVCAIRASHDFPRHRCRCGATWALSIDHRKQATR